MGLDQVKPVVLASGGSPLAERAGLKRVGCKLRMLVTGATGFIGRPLCQRLSSDGHTVRAVSRRVVGARSERRGFVPDWVTVDSIGPTTDWTGALSHIDAVVHLAARVHMRNEWSSSARQHFREVNVLGTERLAQVAAVSGVRRFVFLSTVKVHGEETGKGPSGEWLRITESDKPQPKDSYAISKWEAECVLNEIALESGMELVILRPPLVYGCGVRANFRRLLEMVSRGFPLPFGSVRNLRSFVYVENLVDAIVTCVSHPAALGKTYLVSDADVSTPELIRRMAKALDRPARLVSIRPALLRWAAVAVGQKSAIDRLVGSLVVDSTSLQQETGWSPRHSMDQGLKKTARWFLHSNS